MHYNMKKILSTSALALILSFGYVSLCSAQGIVSLNGNSQTNNAEGGIPDEISLFGDENAEIKVITPAKSTTGVKSAKNLLSVTSSKSETKVKSAAELLGTADNTKTKNGVKSAAELLGTADNTKTKNGVKSAAELLGTADNTKTKNGVKSAAELLGTANNANAQSGVKSAAELLGTADNTKTKNGVKSAAELLGTGGTQQATTTTPQAKETPTQQNVVPKTGNIDVKIVKDIEDNVFDQMSDLEKQTAILNLELKKEKVKSDIEALRAVRAKAIEEENKRKEEEKRKAKEWENAEKRKIIQEQQKLKSIELAIEAARQEKLLNAYKTQMLEEMQKFITSRQETYKEISDLKAERQSLINDFKARFLQLTELADKATSEAIRVRDNYAKTISDLQTQISILNARLEANEQQNPFAQEEAKNNTSDNVDDIKLSDQYAIMEIRGQGDVLFAKLINENGLPFIVRVGTVLQSGHVVDEITTTHVRADKDGNKDYLYFSAGGILDKEPAQNVELKLKVQDDANNPKLEPPAVLANGIPGVASEMTVR